MLLDAYGWNKDAKTDVNHENPPRADGGRGWENQNCITGMMNFRDES